MRPADVETELLRTEGRAIAHLRERHGVRRFGLVLGAGVSIGLGFPSWPKLLQLISEHPDVRAESVAYDNDSGTYRSQVLFQFFKSKQWAKADPQKRDAVEFIYETEVAWKRIIHECLYHNAKHDIIDKAEHYLLHFLPLIRQSPLTVNYNFDDSVERMLLNRLSADERKLSRGYSTAWSASAQIEAKQAVIYHPNGFLPYKLVEPTSQDLILLEDTFADQLIASASGYYSTLVNHISQTTCLLVGLSRDDPTLRHLLRQASRVHPGHFHYSVSYVAPDDKRTDDRKKAEFDANFNVYNLITLFLNSDEIAALGRILSWPQEEYETRVAELSLPVAYRYFLAGSVGVGKTTTLSHFRSLRTLEEWLDPLLESMTRDPEGLTPQQLVMIDAWVDDQLERKNNRLLTQRCGVTVHRPASSAGAGRSLRWAATD